MKINFSRSMSVLAVCSTLLFTACGGGGSGDEGSVSSPSTGETSSKFKYNRISLAGSSITYGAGLLGEKSYVGEVIKYFREDVADTIGPNELKGYSSKVDNNMSYMGKLCIYNAGSEITGSLDASEEISIVVAHSGSDTVVELLDENGASLGEKTIQGTFDPAVRPYPSAAQGGFRENDQRAVFTWSGLDNKNHTFTLKVKQGTLQLNFITNHMYYFQNAGIGGYSTSNFLTTGTYTTTKEIIDFNPDLFIFESATNDANTWQREDNGDSSTNDWFFRGNVIGFTVDDKDRKKIKFDMDISDVHKDDVVVMGTYKGDIRTLAVGVVDSVDTNSKTITLKTEVPQNIDNKCRIKSIKVWEDRVVEVISKVKSGLNHGLTVGIATNGVPNYWSPQEKPEYANYERRLMGYTEKGKILAEKNGWMFFDFFGHLVSKGYTGVEANKPVTDRWSKQDNTHPDVLGYVLFGETITGVLKNQ